MICGKVKETIIKYVVNGSNMRNIIVGRSYPADFMLLEESFLGFRELYHCLLETALLTVPSH
jgi:hypothetical protein